MSHAPALHMDDEAGFARVDIAAVARRQLVVSLGLVAALALATGIAVVSMKVGDGAHVAKNAPAATQQMVKAPFFVRG